MGVDLSDLVTATPRTLEDLRGRSIAIDAFNTLYQFLSIIRQPDGTPLMEHQGRRQGGLQRCDSPQRRHEEPPPPHPPPPPTHAPLRPAHRAPSTPAHSFRGVAPESADTPPSGPLVVHER